MLRCEGQGDLWISSYGAIHEVEVSGTYIVDTTHIVAFEDSLTFQIRRVGGMKGLFLLLERGWFVSLWGRGSFGFRHAAPRPWRRFSIHSGWSNQRRTKCVARPSYNRGAAVPGTRARWTHNGSNCK